MQHVIVHCPSRFNKIDSVFNECRIPDKNVYITVLQKRSSTSHIYFEMVVRVLPDDIIPFSGSRFFPVNDCISSNAALGREIIFSLPLRFLIAGPETGRHRKNADSLFFAYQRETA